MLAPADSDARAGDNQDGCVTSFNDWRHESRNAL